MRTQAWIGIVAVAFTLVAGCADEEPDVVCHCGWPADSYPYVVDGMTLPLDAATAEDLGFDLDGDTTIDNQLGTVLATLIASYGVDTDLQAALTASVLSGESLTLVEISATALTQAANAGVSMYAGANPSPTPCTNPDDPDTCGQHLDGTGEFDIANDSPVDQVVGGNIIGGNFEGDRGGVLLQLRLGDVAMRLDLVAAHVKLTGITETGIADGLVGGALPMADVEAELIPAIEALLLPDVIDATELAALVAPDVDTDDDGEPDALSIGLGLTAVFGVFTPPIQP